MPLNIDKFHLAQAFNDSKGRTSLTKIIAGAAGAVGVMTFGSCAILMYVLVVREAKTDVTTILNSVLMQSVGMVTLSLGSLTARRFSKDKPTTDYDKFESDTNN